MPVVSCSSDRGTREARSENRDAKRKSFGIYLPLCHCNTLVWRVPRLPVRLCKTFRCTRPGIRLDWAISAALCCAVSRRPVLSSTWKLNARWHQRTGRLAWSCSSDEFRKRETRCPRAVSARKRSTGRETCGDCTARADLTSKYSRRSPGHLDGRRRNLAISAKVECNVS